MRQLGIGVFGVVVSLSATQAFAQDAAGGKLLGAQAVLDALPHADAPAVKPATPPSGGVPVVGAGSDVVELPFGDAIGMRPSPATQAKYKKLHADLAAFDKSAPNGAAWAALFERWYALKHPQGDTPDWSQELPLDDVLATLPPPATWPAAAGELRKHHAHASGASGNASQIAVLMFADQLADDVAGLRAHEAQLEALDSQHSYLGFLRDEAARAVAVRAGDDAVARFTADLQRDKDASEGSLRVPDLVTLAGEQRARELLQQALAQSAAQLEIPVGDATRALAGKLALQDIDSLRRPQWNLVRGLDCAPLYEELRKRFIDGAAAPHQPSALSAALHMMVGIRVGSQRERLQNYAEESEHATAKVNYFAALIAQSRSAEAEAVAQSLGRNLSEHDWRPIIDALDRAGYAKQLYEFLDGFMARHPNSDLWERYVELAARNGQQEALLAHTRASLGTPGQAYATILRAHLADALLAADKVDEAAAELRALVEDAGQPAWSRANYGLKLAEIGRLCAKPEWIERGLAAAQPTDKQLADQAMPSDMDSSGGTRAHVQLLRKLGRHADAEKLLSRSLAAERKWQAANGGGSSTTTLIEMMGVYHDAGRDADALILLDKAPNWGVSDVSGLRAYTDWKNVSVLYYASAALHHAGKDAQALPLLETLIERSGGFDTAYELYTRIRGAAAIPFLEKIYAADRFEERPLIWQATLLLRDRKLDEAERVTRAAIAVDPSDGEEGPGDRLRAYAVLADILEARGNATDAALYRNAVQAIRDSEHADEFRLAGMHTRAIAMYTKALERFADAYCIQSRLAVELNASGNTLLAQEHYRRAYELMPSSFGRMESHCLGCENVFGGENAQGIADKVFGDLVVKMPANPQVHYLLGYLREEQDRYAEALSQYKTATQLDADYLNAWKRQREIAGNIDVPAAEQDRVALRLYELDPRGRHVYGVASSITDWPALYALAAKAQARFAAPRATLYPLAASARSLAAGAHASQREMLAHYQRYSDSDVLPTAGGAIAGTGLMRALSQLIEMPTAATP